MRKMRDMKKKQRLHIYYPRRLHKIYEEFEATTHASSVLALAYCQEEDYHQISQRVRSVRAPFIAELSLPMAAQFVTKGRTHADEAVIVGQFTTFARHNEMTLLYYPVGGPCRVEYLEAADMQSCATWLALMYLRTICAPIMGDPQTLLARVRLNSYMGVLDYVISSLRAGVRPLLDAFIVAGWPKAFEDLRQLAVGRLESTSLYDWYFEQADRSRSASPAVTLISKTGIARKRDVEANPEAYRGYCDMWRQWKSQVSGPSKKFSMLSSKVEIEDSEADIACEFISRAREILGLDVLRHIGISEDLRLSTEEDFWRLT